MRNSLKGSFGESSKQATVAAAGALGNMTNHDLKVVYEFLKALPPAQPGVCTGPGEPTP